MQQIVECVPNFSEGRNLDVINKITAEIEKTPGAVLLDVDPGADTNRTVVTFVGSPDAVVEAAFLAIRKAAELIDMRQHQGAHPRMGATDVCPFVPVRGLTMEDCVALARQLGQRVGEELGIPVYLYEYAATSPERRNLATVRAGEYEGLEAKLQDPQWRPDFGPAQFNPTAGATAIGARKFLIAYNVNLNTRDRKLARDIALDIREKGRARRDEQGKIMRDENGNIIRRPGTLKAVKAVGWYIDEYSMAQVSINLTDFETTPLYKVFDEVVRQAEKRGLRVTGSEIVGMIPLQAISDAGKYYLEKQGKTAGVPERELVRIAIQTMGLNEVSRFDPDERIIEYRLEKELGGKRLRDLSLREFLDELSTDSPAPGGGSVSALAGSLAAALTSMVAALTHGKKGYEEVFSEMAELGSKAQKLKQRLLELIDEDTRAFDAVMAAMRLPKKTDEQKAERAHRIQAATVESIKVPLEVMETCMQVMELAGKVATKGNRNSLSDAGVALLQARAGLEGAAYNVLINLPGLEDKEQVSAFRSRVQQLRQQAEELAQKYGPQVEKILQEALE